MPAPKTKHFRFDSEEPELPVEMETEVPEPQQKDQDNEDSSDDDEAPEAIDNSAEMSKIRLEARKREQARQMLVSSLRLSKTFISNSKSTVRNS